MKNNTPTKIITQTAVFSALSFALYFVKFPLPIFPFWLKLHVSDLPALLGGFSMGPLWGCLIVLIKELLYLPIDLPETQGVGVLADFLAGIAFVLTASLIYKYNRTKKGAIASLIFGVLATTAVSALANVYILIPFFAKIWGFEGIVSAVSALIPSTTSSTFYLIYVFVFVVPFNILRAGLSALLSFFVYKRLEKISENLFVKKEKINEEDNK